MNFGMEKLFKIYCLKHPISNQIRYVGITSKSIKHRLYQHISDSREDKKVLPVHKWIYSLKLLSLKPIIEILEEVNEDNWEQKEREWIEKLGRNNKLLNIDKGGRGIIIGKTREEANRNVIEAHKKKICQFTINDELIKIWDSMSEATKFFNGKTKSSIGNAASINYRVKTAYGYKWQFYSDYIQKLPLKVHMSIEEKSEKNSKGKVLMLDLEGNVIKEFHNTKYAAAYLDVDGSRISESILHGEKVKRKYLFQRINKTNII